MSNIELANEKRKVDQLECNYSNLRSQVENSFEVLERLIKTLDCDIKQNRLQIQYATAAAFRAMKQLDEELTNTDKGATMNDNIDELRKAMVETSKEYRCLRDTAVHGNGLFSHLIDRKKRYIAEYKLAEAKYRESANNWFTKIDALEYLREITITDAMIQELISLGENCPEVIKAEEVYKEARERFQAASEGANYEE